MIFEGDSEDMIIDGKIHFKKINNDFYKVTFHGQEYLFNFDAWNKIALEQYNAKRILNQLADEED